MCGATKDAGVKGVDLDNVEYVLINNLGVVTGKSLGLSQSASLAIGSASHTLPVLPTFCQVTLLHS